MGYIELNVLNNAESPLVMGIALGTTNSLAATNHTIVHSGYMPRPSRTVVRS